MITRQELNAIQRERAEAREALEKALQENSELHKALAEARSNKSGVAELEAEVARLTREVRRKWRS